MDDKVHLLSWDPKESHEKIYKKIVKYNKLCNGKHPLYLELFKKVDGKYLQYKDLKTVKDFNIKSMDIVKCLRKIHKNNI